MAFDSELSGVSAAAEDVGVCEWGLAFGAYEGRAVFSFASVYMYSPCHLQGVPPSPVGRRRVCVNCVVCTGGSSFLEDLPVYGGMSGRVARCVFSDELL